MPIRISVKINDINNTEDTSEFITDCLHAISKCGFAESRWIIEVLSQIDPEIDPEEVPDGKWEKAHKIAMRHLAALAVELQTLK